MKFLTNQLKNIPSFAGIYKFYTPENFLLYVGKAKNLKNRVNSYFTDDEKDSKTLNLISKIKYIESIPVASEFEALLLEARLIKQYQPKYNVLWKDDKHYIYIKITKEKFPKVLFARKPNLQDEFFGPFPSSKIVKDILSYIRSIFPFCTQNEKSKRACFYHHIGLCNPCPAALVKDAKNYRLLYFMYRRNIRHITELLHGEIGKVKKHILNQMSVASKNLNYEEAAVYRDKLDRKSVV